MRRLLIIGVVLLAGCQGQDVASQAQGDQPSVPTTAVDKPASLSATDSTKFVRADIGLLDHSERVEVGDTWEEALRVFSEPKGAFEFNDLPPMFAKPYAARGWETSREGFGVILYNDRVVAAMRQSSKITQSTLDDVVAEHQREFGKPNWIAGKHVQFWFWQKPPQRLMICALQTLHDGLQMTAVVGDDTVLDALGMGEERANREKDQVDTSFDMRTGPQNRGTSANH